MVDLIRRTWKEEVGGDAEQTLAARVAVGSTKQLVKKRGSNRAFASGRNEFWAMFPSHRRNSGHPLSPRHRFSGTFIPPPRSRSGGTPRAGSHSGPTGDPRGCPIGFHIYPLCAGFHAWSRRAFRKGQYPHPLTLRNEIQRELVIPFDGSRS